MATSATRSQTLDRGLMVLEIVSSAPRPVAISEVAATTGLHRSIVYRLMRTLEDHGLVFRNNQDRFGPGYGLLTLSGRLARGLAAVATPVLRSLADSNDVTAYIAVRDGQESVTLCSVERPDVRPMPAARPGARRRIDVGAAGYALRSFDESEPQEHPAVRHARDRGWVRTCGETVDDLCCVAAPVHGYQVPTALCVVYTGRRSPEPLIEAVRTAATHIGSSLMTGTLSALA